MGPLVCRQREESKLSELDLLEGHNCLDRRGEAREKFEKIVGFRDILDLQIQRVVYH